MVISQQDQNHQESGLNLGLAVFAQIEISKHDCDSLGEYGRSQRFPDGHIFVRYLYIIYLLFFPRIEHVGMMVERVPKARKTFLEAVPGA